MFCQKIKMYIYVRFCVNDITKLYISVHEKMEAVNIYQVQ